MVPAMDKDTPTKSKDECWTDFWDIIGPALVDLHQKGLLVEAEQPAAA